MKARVTEQGVMIPRHFFPGVEEVEIRKDRNMILLVPIAGDPILGLGREPVAGDLDDGSVNHDRYLCNS
ncbi:MAG: hypothetical protein L0312_33305 [Acidobacteria bacterium]|nr:hypothetical protein [Acidobacteriota bacterium]